MNLQKRADAAVRIAYKAGEMLRNAAGFESHEKADNDFVTEMDTRSEQMIREALLGEFPEDTFFGEESGGSESTDGRWIVDPIDGTYSFMRGHHGYTISIAYQYRGDIAIGCVYMPDNDEMFLAIRGRGATVNGKPIHVSEISDMRHSLAHFGYGHRVPEHLEFMMRTLPNLCRAVSDLRRFGSAAYALCCVACGRSEAFLEMGLSLYDFAAGLLLVEEAGGTVTGWLPGEDCKETGCILATNGRLHDAYRELLNREPHPQ